MIRMRVRFYVGHSVQDADGNTVREHPTAHVVRVASAALAASGVANTTAYPALGTWNGTFEHSTVFEHVSDAPDANDMASAPDPHGPAGNEFRPRMIRAARRVAAELEQSEVLVTFDVVDACPARAERTRPE